MEVLRPESEDDVREAVAWALANDKTLEVLGAGSKRDLGRPVEAEAGLSLSGLSGISLYEPEELVLTAGPGTLLSEIDARLAQHGQCLAFEPPDLGPLLGGASGRATLGGVLAANLSGPRRIKVGAARDHFLGVRAVSGRAEVFKSGGRVVKNVTGYDLCKLLAGSWGTLAAMTEVTVKVLPAAEDVRTLILAGLDDASGVAAMTRALGSPNDVSAAAHLPAEAAAASAVARVREMRAGATALRVEGPARSVAARCAALRDMFVPAGGIELDELDRPDSDALWREIAGVSCLVEPADRAIWRLSVPPASGAAVVAAIGGARAVYDWGGGLVWLAVSAEGNAAAGRIRRAVDEVGGHAMLVRAPPETRRAVPVFHPQPAGRAGLSRRVKDAFDPKGVLNPGRMYAGA